MARDNSKINAPDQAKPRRPEDFLSLTGEIHLQEANDGLREPIVFVREGGTRTTSREVAEFFGRRHDDVLKAIRRLNCSESFRARNFAEFKINDLTGEKTSHVEMTKDGFTFLAFGFTGTGAGRFKEAYIAAFNRMEAMLQGNAVAMMAGLAEKIERDLGISKSLMRKVSGLERDLAKLEERHVQALVAADPRHRAVFSKTSLEILVDQGVPPHGRRILSQRVSGRLKTYCKQRKIMVEEMAYPRRNLFPVEAIQGWLRDEGANMIRDHIDDLEGRRRLPFPESKVVRLRR